MAEYIERDKAIEKINAYCELRQAIYSNDKDEFLRGLQTALKAISCNDVIPNANVQPVRKWVNDKILSPSVDGDYLVLYRGYFNVFERFKEKWFDEKGVEVDTKDLLWWQELPPMPEATKG